MNIHNQNNNPKDSAAPPAETLPDATATDADAATAKQDETHAGTGIPITKHDGPPYVAAETAGPPIPNTPPEGYISPEPAAHVNRPPKAKVNPLDSLEIDGSRVPVIAVFAAITAFLYSISFTGIQVYPQLSFFIFCGITVVLLYVLLKRLEWLNHPRGFLWAVPLMIFAGFNMVFGRTVFTYINVAAVWILFAFIIFGVIHGARYPFGALFFWGNTFKVLPGNVWAGMNIWLATGRATKITKNHPAIRFIIGIGIAIPLAFIIILLMVSADQVFATLIADFFAGYEEPNIARFFGHIIVIFLACIFLAGYVYNARFMKHSEAWFKPFNLDKIVALAFLLVLNLVFLAFCYVQLAYLFMGGFNTLPGDIIFADYARQGFFQLLFITIINFTVIIFFLQVYRDHARVGIIRLMLVMLTLFTGVLIASSFYRMNMYMQVFGFTPLRMAVITFLVMEVLLCVFTLLALFKDKFDIMRVYLITGMVFLVVANVSASGFVSGRLNVNLYRSRGFHFTMRDHFFSADNAGNLLDVYRLTDNTTLQLEIHRRIQYYYDSYTNEPWQNRSIMKRINMRRMGLFLEDNPYIFEKHNYGRWRF
ncbi:MAG: DUF4173 domain-containing protein [Defluviitaleaceae bacterium]|nr:DUF4173 domain-containing protein [Defluviitaleaceae bacterium]